MNEEQYNKIKNVSFNESHYTMHLLRNIINIDLASDGFENEIIINECLKKFANILKEIEHLSVIKENVIEKKKVEHIKKR